MDIFLVFPGKGDVGNRDWYLIPHDKLFGILKQKHGHAPQWNHVKHGEYWHCPVSRDLAEYLTEYSIDLFFLILLTFQPRYQLI